MEGVAALSLITQSGARNNVVGPTGFVPTEMTGSVSQGTIP